MMGQKVRKIDILGPHPLAFLVMSGPPFLTNSAIVPVMTASESGLRPDSVTEGKLSKSIGFGLVGIKLAITSASTAAELLDGLSMVLEVELLVETEEDAIEIESSWSVI